METRAEPEGAESLRCSRQRRHGARERPRERRALRGRRAGDVREEGKHLPDRGRPGGRARGRRGGRLPRSGLEDLRCDPRGGAARILQGLRQGVHGAPQHPDRAASHVPERGSRQGLRGQARRADRGQGRRAGRGKRRGRGGQRRRGAGRHRPHDDAEEPRRSRRAGRGRGVPAGRGSELHRHERRHERAAARHQPGPQATARRRRGPQHRRHGRLLAGADRHAEDPRPGDARDHPARHPGHGAGGHSLQRFPVRRPDDRPVGKPEGARIQLPPRRPGDAADHAAAQIGPARARRARACRQRFRGSRPNGTAAPRSAS